MNTYPDAVLDYYADRFILLGLARHGLNLEQYLANPERSERLGDYYRQRLDCQRLNHCRVRLTEYLHDPARFAEIALEEEQPLPAQHAAILRIWAQHDTGLPRRLPRPPVGVKPHWSDGQMMDWRDLVRQWRDEAAERDVAHLPQRNGTIVEPLHHHRHERRHNTNFIKKAAQRGA